MSENGAGGKLGDSDSGSGGLISFKDIGGRNFKQVLASLFHCDIIIK